MCHSKKGFPDPSIAFHLSPLAPLATTLEKAFGIYQVENIVSVGSISPYFNLTS